MIKRDAHARITLALDILRKLTSGPYAGYHELSIVKHQLSLHDTISIREWPEMKVECDDPTVPCDRTNICHRAADALKRKFGIDKNVNICIEKRIPVMGGMAGGSTDAAAALQALMELWNLQLPPSELVELARSLGMDVPYFFLGGTAVDSETTGEISPVLTGVSMVFVLVVPDFGVSTREAYAGIDYSRVAKDRGKTGDMLRAFEANDAEKVRAAMHNDFETSVFGRHPRLREIASELVAAGAVAACMSGSGSTMVGAAHDMDEAAAIAGFMEKRPSVRRVLTASSFHHR